MLRTRPWIVVALVALISAARLHTQSSPQPLALSEQPGTGILSAAVSDGSGGIWVAGRSTGDMGATADALQPHVANSSYDDAVVIHFGADGHVLYATYLGGSQEDYASAIDRDAAGNIYVAGATVSSDFPSTAGSFSTPSGGDLNVFVVKLDPTGRRLLYSTHFGGPDFDEAYGVAVDAAGIAHVVGVTHGAGFPVTWGRCLPNMQSTFYARISADGASLQSSTCLDQSTPRAVTLDANGDAYVVGVAWQGFPIQGSPSVFKTTFPTDASTQGFLTKMSGHSNSIVFSGLVGGSSTDAANGVAVSSKGIYVAGGGYSNDYPGAPVRHPATANETAWITKITLDGQAFLGTTLIDGDGNDSAQSLRVDSSEVVHVTGTTGSPNFPVTSDAAQPVFGGGEDTWYATASMPNNVVGDPSYVTFLGGGNHDFSNALAADANTGDWIVGSTMSSDFPSVNAKTDGSGEGFVARFGQPVFSSGHPDIVLYTHDATPIRGNWQLVADATAALGARIWNPDGGVPKISTPAAQPANYFDMTFNAEAGIPYHFWLRMKADNDSYQNDSVFVQFSDSVDATGHSLWQIGTSSATVVSLEDCSGCGEQGWGWNDNGYGTAGTPVYFATTAPHTIRIQQREDGISIDQIVLSSERWTTTAPGANKDDTTIVPQGGASNQPPTLSLTSPTDGATHSAPAAVTVTGTASDPDGSVSDVSIYINGELKSSGQPPNGQISATWYDLPAGTYVFTVAATDNQGATTTSSPRTVTVSGSASNQPPTVSITSPANGTTAQGPVPWLPVNASASDSDGTVAKVDFYANSTLVWTSTTAPYHFTWESAPPGTYTLTAVATDNDGAATTSAPVTVTIRPTDNALPYFADHEDIGDVGAAGDATYSDGTFTVQGSGADVWGTADAFHYAEETLARDGAIIARVATVSDESNWVKAGVMIRGSLSPDSAQAFMLVSHAKGVCFQRRVSDGNSSVSTCGSMSTAPRWVKLVRTGNMISGYESADGTAWTMVGSDTFTFATTGVYVGLAVSSHIAGTLATATFDDANVIDAVGPNQPPSVSITSPSGGATFAAPATIAIGAHAIDDVGVARLDFYANSTLIGSVNGSYEIGDYTFTWSNVPAGTYTLTVVATDGDGASTTSSPVSITVNGSQAGGQCSSLTLSRTSFYSGGPASDWRITVTAPNDTCTWTASIDQSWLTLDGVTGPTTIAGTGSGQITLQTSDNRTGANRHGTFTIGGTAYTVTQEPF